MIFGIRIPARTMRAGPTGTYATHLPNSSAPIFTVRRFMGQILGAVRPFYGATQMFGKYDIYELRLVFADWPQGATEEFPVQGGDYLVLPMGTDSSGHTIYRTYDVRGQESFPGSHIEIYVGATPRGQ